MLLTKIPDYARLNDSHPEFTNLCNLRNLWINLLLACRWFWPFSSTKMSAGEFFVDHPMLRRFVAATETILKEQIEVTDRLWQLRRPYAELLNDSSWLPDEFRQPDCGLRTPRFAFRIPQFSVSLVPQCFDRIQRRCFMCRVEPEPNSDRGANQNASQSPIPWNNDFSLQEHG
jgi:hypothetical protein